MALKTLAMKTKRIKKQTIGTRSSAWDSSVFNSTTTTSKLVEWKTALLLFEIWYTWIYKHLLINAIKIRSQRNDYAQSKTENYNFKQ